MPGVGEHEGRRRAEQPPPGARLATEKISRLWEIAVERSGNPALGLAQAQVVRPASFDVVGYTMMSCANLQDAFERLVRYLRILSDALTIYRSEERGRPTASRDATRSRASFA